MKRSLSLSLLLQFFLCQPTTAQNNDSLPLAQQLINQIRSSDLNSWKDLADALSSAFGIKNDSESSHSDDQYTNARKKALQWLSQDQYALSLASEANNNNESNNKHIQLLQRYALATIYYGTIQNSEWSVCAPKERQTYTECDHDDHRFLSPVDHSQWEGINCKDKLITWLDLNTKNLSNCPSDYNKQNHKAVEYNMLPMELTLLSPSLELLWLHSNPLCGTLPLYIGEFTNLQSLSAYSTNMGGTLPQSLYGIEKLASIRLYKSNFEGGIGEDVKKLKNLKWLWIHDNGFTGTFPDLAGHSAAEGMITLEGVTLHGNKFDKDNMRGLCRLLRANLKYLWTDCAVGSMEKKDEKWVAVKRKRACECCTRCFPSENDSMAVD